MDEERQARVVVRRARVGRPSSGARTFRPNELIRVEIRMPAALAAQLFELAAASSRPVSATASDLLAAALSEREADTR